ncbi:hypothetical protein MM239_20535 [Belliella sp. DSM 111904]|uniref:Tetratricopeptide repeat-containing protein n=1 Tax=Belliella filtrata TaxID=2923435 RepID=A0ABS9V5T7_9BACT|nr:hypothetical protein [Belliella filtrata]MCH7411786.1 hypothetical protein [Belliella filtrata]
MGSYFKDLWAETSSLEDLDSARYYLEKSLTIKASLQDVRGSINTINLLAEVARENKDYVTAQKLLTQALEFSNGLQNTEIQISLLYELTSFNLELNNKVLALRYAQKAMELANDMNSPYQIGSAAGILSSVSESLGDYKNANEYIKLKLSSEQKLNREQTKNIREELLIKYEVEKTQELEQSNIALVQSNRSRQLLFSILSHDLKSLLLLCNLYWSWKMVNTFLMKNFN